MVVSYEQFLVATKCLIYLPTYIVTTYTLHLLTYDTNLLTWELARQCKLEVVGLIYGIGYQGSKAW